MLVNNTQTMDMWQMYNSLSSMSALNTIYNYGTTATSAAQPSLAALFGSAPVANINMSTVSSLATTSSTASCSSCIGGSVQAGQSSAQQIADSCLPQCISLQSINAVQQSTGTPVSTSFTDFLNQLNASGTGFASILTPHASKFHLSSAAAVTNVSTSNAITDSAAQLMPLVLSGQMLNGANAAFGDLQPGSSGAPCSTYISAQTCTPYCLSITDNTDLGAVSQCMSGCGSNACILPDNNQVNTMRIAVFTSLVHLRSPLHASAG